MEIPPTNLTHTLQQDSKEEPNNTLTFVIGFGVLILFLVMGIAASAFLCLTLKKDSYLWESEINRQLQEKAKEKENAEPNAKERDKGMGDEISLQSTQV